MRGIAWIIAAIAGVAISGCTQTGPAPEAQRPARTEPVSEEALARANLETLWVYPSEEALREPIANLWYEQGALLVEFAAGELRKFDRKIGLPVWPYKLSGPMEFAPGVYRYPEGAAGPGVHDEVFLIQRGGRLVSLDEKYGALNWDVPVETAVASAPTALERQVFFGTHGGSVCAVEKERRVVIWSFITGGSVTARPAAEGLWVFAGSEGGGIFGLSAERGFVPGESWELRSLARVVAPPLVFKGRVYAASTDFTIFCLHPTDGSTPDWMYHAGAAVRRPMMGIGEAIYAITEAEGAGGVKRHALISIRRTRSDLRWKVRGIEEIVAPGHGDLFALTRAGEIVLETPEGKETPFPLGPGRKLVCLDQETGTLKGTVPVDGFDFVARNDAGSGRRADDVGFLVLGSRDGLIQAIRQKHVY